MAVKSDGAETRSGVHSFSAENRPPGRLRKYVPKSNPLRAAGVGFTEATSKAGRGWCCAKAIHRGASEPVKMRALPTIVIAATLLTDARGEKARPLRNSTSIRLPRRNLLPKIPTASSSRDSVGNGFLHVVDHQHFNRSLRRFQLQSELLTKSRKNRRSVIEITAVHDLGSWRTEIEAETKCSGESGSVDYRTVQDIAKGFDKFRDGYFLAGENVGAAEQSAARSSWSLTRRWERRWRIGTEGNTICVPRPQPFQAPYRGHQPVNGHLSYLAASNQFEPVFQQRLQHQPGLIESGVAFHRRRGDVVPGGIDPSRSVQEAGIVHFVSELDKRFQARVGCCKSAAVRRKRMRVALNSAGIEFHGGDFEGRPGLLLCESDPAGGERTSEQKSA